MAQHSAPPDVRLCRAGLRDLPVLLPLVSIYHRLEGIRQSERVRRAALRPLLSGRESGIIWMIQSGRETVGYLAVCFCHSIEFGGRDCFIDEFFIEESFRGRGIGARVLEVALARLARLGIKAVSLEVARNRRGAAAFYAAHGFKPRDRYKLLTRQLAGA